MSSSVTVRPVRGVRGIGLFAIIVGIVMILAGGVTYGMVTSQLRDENITVSDGAQFLAGHRVQGPFSAYAQAEIINKHALAATDGQTFAQLPQDDPRRTTVMNGSFLRASLFTSVVAFGVAVLVVALGVLFLLIGIALRKLGRGDVSVLDVVPASAASGASPVSPAAPVAPVAPSSAPPVTPVTPPERQSSRHAAPPEASAPVAPDAPVATAGAAARAAQPTSFVPPEQPATPSAAPRGPLPTEPEAPSSAVSSSSAPATGEGHGEAEGDARESLDENLPQPPSEPGPARPEDGPAR